MNNLMDKEVDELVLDVEESFEISKFQVKDFKNCGVIFSTDSATCPMCGKHGDVFADIYVAESPKNRNERIVTSEITCTHCKKRLGWGFKVIE